jgi:hypothetical protein
MVWMERALELTDDRENAESIQRRGTLECQKSTDLTEELKEVELKDLGIQNG